MKALFTIALFIVSLSLGLSLAQASPLDNLPCSNRPLRIGFFSGTFDPPTMGHLKVSQSSLNHGLDYLIAVPNNQTAHKPNATPFSLRRKMTEVAYQSEPRILVPSEALDGPNLMIEAIHFVKRCLPNTTVVSVIGSDVANLMAGREPGYKAEQNADWIALINEWLVLRRGNDRSAQDTELFGKKVTTIEDVNVGTSSSAIRKKVNEGDDDWDYDLQPAVAELVLHYRLYAPICEELFKTPSR